MWLQSSQQMFMVWAVIQIGASSQTVLLSQFSFLWNQATKYLAPSTVEEKPSSVSNLDTPGAAQNAEAPATDPRLLPPVDAVPYWPVGVTFDLHVYLSTMPKLDVYTKWSSAYRKDKDEGLPHFVWENITYGNYIDHRVANLMVNFPEVRLAYIS